MITRDFLRLTLQVFPSNLSSVAAMGFNRRATSHQRLPSQSTPPPPLARYRGRRSHRHTTTGDDTNSTSTSFSTRIASAAVMNPFGGASVPVKPPEKGSFPLDRAGQCRKVAHEFLGCIETNGRDYSACKDLSKAYLQCRMDKNLMQKEDLDKLGFKEKAQQPPPQSEGKGEDGAGGSTDGGKGERRDASFYDRKREAEGFVAGTGVKSGRKGFFS